MRTSPPPRRLSVVFPVSSLGLALLLSASCGPSNQRAKADPLDRVRDAIARGDMEEAEACSRPTAASRLLRFSSGSNAPSRSNWTAGC